MYACTDTHIYGYIHTYTPCFFVVIFLSRSILWLPLVTLQEDLYYIKLVLFKRKNKKSNGKGYWVTINDIYLCLNMRRKIQNHKR